MHIAEHQQTSADLCRRRWLPRREEDMPGAFRQLAQNHMPKGRRESTARRSQPPEPSPAPGADIYLEVLSIISMRCQRFFAGGTLFFCGSGRFASFFSGRTTTVRAGSRRFSSWRTTVRTGSRRGPSWRINGEGA